VWVLHDLLLRRPMKWRESLVVLIPGLIGAWFGFQRLAAMQEPNPGRPYYMDLQAITMGRGFGYYFNTLFSTQFRWQVWCIGFVAVLILFALLRWWLVLFFQAYVFVTFLPVIFLINHRDPMYWYFPMLGVCGMGAMLTKVVTDWIVPRVSERRLPVYAAVAFALLSLAVYRRSSGETAARRQWQQEIVRNYRGFVDGVRTLPPPAPGEVLYFTSIPEYFDSDTLRFASEFAFGRKDIDAKLVESFPAGARYRLVFENARVVMREE
jgi:hypothetical protein